MHMRCKASDMRVLVRLRDRTVRYCIYGVKFAVRDSYSALRGESQSHCSQCMGHHGQATISWDQKFHAFKKRFDQKGLLHEDSPAVAVLDVVL